jgi:hypothetical protein
MDIQIVGASGDLLESGEVTVFVDGQLSTMILNHLDNGVFQFKLSFDVTSKVTENNVVEIPAMKTERKPRAKEIGRKIPKMRNWGTVRKDDCHYFSGSQHKRILEFLEANFAGVPEFARELEIDYNRARKLIYEPKAAWTFSFRQFILNRCLGGGKV